jgi:hypothetical protein
MWVKEIMDMKREIEKIDEGHKQVVIKKIEEFDSEQHIPKML